MLNDETKIEAVSRYIEAFDKADLSMIRALYAEDAVVEDPVGSDPYRGMEAICEFYESGISMGAKLKRTGAVRLAGNSAAFPFIVEAAGMKIEVIDVFEFNDAGKVVSMRAYWGAGNTIA